MNSNACLKSALLKIRAALISRVLIDNLQRPNIDILDPNTIHPLIIIHALCL